MSAIDPGAPSEAARETEAALTRLDEWKAAYVVLQAHFDSFGPYDVMTLISYLRGGELKDDA